MTDIVAELRATANSLVGADIYEDEGIEQLLRAADEIERLRNELAAHDALCHPEAFEETSEHDALDDSTGKPGCE